MDPSFNDPVYDATRAALDLFKAIKSDKVLELSALSGEVLLMFMRIADDAASELMRRFPRLAA